MDHKSIRYKSTQITHQNQDQELFNQQLAKPTFNQYISSQCSYKSSNSNAHPVKSRSKHEVFRPNLRSEEQQSDDYRLYPDSVSQCTRRHGTQRIQKQYGLMRNRQDIKQIEGRYKNIQTLLQEENQNLKQQNSLLLQQLRKANNKEKKYKQLYMKTHEELIITSQERDQHRQQFCQLKDIVENQMSAFQQKLSLVTLGEASYKKQDRQMLANDFNSFKRKVSLQKMDSDVSDNTNSDTM